LNAYTVDKYLERHPIRDCIAVLIFTIVNGLRF